MATSIRQAAEANLANGIPTSLGQALAADSMPVVLPALQVTALTPPAAISGFATSAKQLADGHGVVATILPANVTTLTPPTAAAIASAIVANPPAVATTEASGAAIAADLNELTAAPVAKNWVMGGAVVAAGPAPAPLAASETFARKVIMTAVKAAGTANTGVVYVGDANLIDTTAACIQLAPGESFTLEGSPGTKFDLNLLKMDGANVGDGVRYIYQPI